MSIKQERLTNRLRLAPGTYTALQVWERVLQIIEEEPLRVDMRRWKSLLRGEGYCDLLEPAPACGTVLCLAGWFNFITVGDPYGGVGMPSARALDRMEPVYDDRCWEVKNELNDLFFRVKYSAPEVISKLREILNTYREDLSLLQVTVR